jgi:hypothetical protein
MAQGIASLPAAKVLCPASWLASALSPSLQVEADYLPLYDSRHGLVGAMQAQPPMSIVMIEPQLLVGSVQPYMCSCRD